MKIAICGTHCTGKSTLVKDFIKAWPNYRTKTETYRDLVKSKGLVINENGTEDSQMAILNFVVDQIIYEPKETDLILDRSVLDNLAYTLWLNEQGKVSDAFVQKTMKIVRETLPFYDILFFVPLTAQSPIKLEGDGVRSEDEQYREEIDNIFKSLAQKHNQHSKTFFPFDHALGCPALCEIFGNREERISLIKMYLNESGQPFGEDESLINVSE